MGKQADKVRALLAQHPDGLNTKQLAALMGISPQSATIAARDGQGIRVLRWERQPKWGRPYIVWGLGNESDARPLPKFTDEEYKERRRATGAAYRERKRNERKTAMGNA